MGEEGLWFHRGSSSPTVGEQGKGRGSSTHRPQGGHPGPSKESLSRGGEEPEPRRGCVRSLLSQSCPAWGQPGPWGQPGRLVWVELSEQLRWVIPEVSCAPASPGGHRALSTSDGPLGGGATSCWAPYGWPPQFYGRSTQSHESGPVSGCLWAMTDRM